MKKFASTKVQATGLFATLLRPFFLSALICLLLAFLLAGAQLLTPSRFGHLVDGLAREGFALWTSLRTPFVEFLLLLLLWFLAQLLLNRQSLRLSRQLYEHGRSLLFDKLVNLDYQALQKCSKGELQQLWGINLPLLKECFSPQLFQSLAQSLLLLGILFTLFQLSPLLGVELLLFSPLSYLFTRYVAHHSVDAFRRYQTLQAELTSLQQEVLEQRLLIRSLGREEEMLSRHRQLLLALDSIGRRAQFISALTNPTARLINYSAYLVLGLTAMNLQQQSTLSEGEVLTVLAYVLAYAACLQGLAQFLGQIQRARAAFEQLQNFWQLASAEEPPAEQRGDASTSSSNCPSKPISSSPADETTALKRGQIRFQDLSFAYEDAPPLYENFQLSLPAGQQIALVGTTGCGKTTLVDLLLRFIQCQQGQILLDGQPINQAPRSDYYQEVCMLPQECSLPFVNVADVLGLAPSREEQLAKGEKGISELAEVQALLQKLQAYHWLEQSTEGLWTDLQQLQLSAGQRQQLLLARMLWKQPPVLILDESTSYVDPQLDQEIQQQLRERRKELTTLVISHRLRPLLKMDWLVVLGEGRLLEQGKPADLLKKGGAFARLWAAAEAEDQCFSE